MKYEVFNIVQDYMIQWIEYWKPLYLSNTQWVATLGLSGFAIYLLYKMIIYRLYIHPANRLPGPRVSWIPFMGNYFDIVTSNIDESPFRRWTEQYGGIYAVHHNYNEPRVIVTDPKLVKQILTLQVYDFEKPPGPAGFIRRIAGNGLLVAEVNTRI